MYILITIAIRELRPQFEPAAGIYMALCPQTINPPSLQVKVGEKSPRLQMTALLQSYSRSFYFRV